MCSQDPIFGTNKNGILKNGSCEGAFRGTGRFTGILAQTDYQKLLCHLMQNKLLTTDAKLEKSSLQGSKSERGK